MLDTFLDISPHLVSFRKLEKEIGQSMHLRDRNVVPWKDRERFETVYKMHLQIIATQEEHARRVQTDQVRSPHKTSHHRHSRHHHHKESINLNNTKAEELDKVPMEACVAPLPTPVKFDTTTEEARPGESVQDRMARIGHRLVVEAFEA
ncbi:Hypothetical protein PHPALM_20748 [Phytophthora palmivora]|uniref:Uncharacterized protein n=1 Tax=Phytophthora palmivora TaxID=4796 RepID=A0A2P4XE27_9STRA|nr:Hypothetical protein PHPALM_20748 [Phytophthora palmivora]